MMMKHMMCAAAVVVGLMVGAAAVRGESGIRNGGFEEGVTGWQWEEWKGLPVPGFVDREDSVEGQASFKMTLPGKEGSRYITHALSGEFVPEKAYVLKISLMAKEMPEKAGTVRLLMNGMEKPDANGKATPQGWVEVPPRSGVSNLITIGGTQEWKTYSVEIPAGAIKPKTTSVRVIITHAAIGQGVLGIDGITWTEREPVAALPKAAVLTATTYDVAEAAVLKPVPDAAVAWQLSPEKSLYRPGELTGIELKAAKAARVSWKILDGFGKEIATGKVPADAASAKVTLPENHGYYELIATAEREGKVIGEARRSLGVLSAPASAEGSEPFGLWCGGADDYQELGVRWVRSGLYPELYAKDPAGYLQSTRERIEAYHRQGIRVLVYPKGHPKAISVSHKVSQDRPEAWAELEEYWRALVKGLKGSADAWGIINEPYRGMWDGTDDLIVRYWALMRKVIDSDAPGTPLIGPSLNVNEPTMMLQYRELLERGYGRLINGVELHTYTSSAMPEDIDWLGKIQQTRELTRAATGTDLPVWSSEMGTTVAYGEELFQAQYLMRCFVWAKRMELPMLLWHMHDWPAGSPQSEREYAIFRMAVGGKMSQPRPAGVAYGVMTRQLAGARYRTQLDYLGASTYAFVFERRGEAMIALWRTSGSAVVRVPVQRPSVTVVDLFGKSENRPTDEGFLAVEASPSVQFIGPVDRQLLDAQPLAKAGGRAALLAGGEAVGTVTITNPTDASAQVALRWTPMSGWSVTPATVTQTLEPREQVQVSVRISAPADARFGSAVVYARGKLNGKDAGVASVPVEVLPRAQIVAVRPTMENDRPALAVTLKRNDPALREAVLTMGGQTQRVKLEGESAQCVIRPTDVNALELQEYDVTLSDGKRQQDQSHQRLSFVGVRRASSGLVVDGDLSDWPELANKPVETFALAWRWSPEQLYLAVRVHDKMHVQRQNSDGLWKDDSVQVAIAPEREEDLIRRWVAEMAESNYSDLCVGLKGGHALMYRYATTNREAAALGDVKQGGVKSAVRRNGEFTEYEIAMPVRSLGLKPLKSGQVVRGSVAVNRNDGDGRTYWEWFSGITRGAQPQKYGHLILED